MTAKHRTADHGKMIRLSWECEPEFIAVRGHVNLAAFEAAVLEFDPEGYGPDFYAQPRHAWAFWGANGMDSVNDNRQLFLMLRNAPGRGRFPVTVTEEVRTPKRLLPAGAEVRVAGCESVGRLRGYDYGTTSLWCGPLAEVEIDGVVIKVHPSRLRVGSACWEEIDDDH